MAPAQAATSRPDRDAGDDPIAGPGLLDPEVDHRHVGVGELGEIRIDDPDVGVEDLSDGECLAGAQVESAEAHGAGVEGHGLGLDRGHPQHRHENPTPSGQFDREAEDARLLPGHADRDHHVADASDGLAVGTKDGQPD